MNREALSVCAMLLCVATLATMSGCPPCRTDADCGDGLFCNGAERCIDEDCQEGDPPCAIYEDCDEESDTCAPLDPVARARRFLDRMTDQYHGEWFDVYTDRVSAGNHFLHLAMMRGGIGPEQVLTDGTCTDHPRRGATCIENKFLGRGTGWGGYYHMNGILRENCTVPEANWGNDSNAGLDLSGASEVEFWARGEQGGERVEFFALGVGWDIETKSPVQPYPDSSPKRSTGYVELGTDWKRYSIPLQGVNLTYVLGGFAWVTNAPQNQDRDVIFYLDDIRYKLARPTVPRLLQSYVPRNTDSGSGSLLRNLATTYDNALAILAFLALGDTDRAKLIADAFVYAQNHDRWFDDGRLRNGYQAGDLAMPPGWKLSERDGTVRLPGWWGSANGNSPSWHVSNGFVGSKVGDLAWPIIALLAYREAASASGDDEHLRAAVALGEWIEDHCRSTQDYGGYTGGYEWREPNLAAVRWKSTEHNIDAYVAFTRLSEATGDSVWADRAAAARQFVEAMWNDQDGHFWTGTTEAGEINPEVIPLDVQAWAVLALGSGSGYEDAMTWAEANCALEHDGYHGFDFNRDLDGVWFEGTAHAALTYRELGQFETALFYLQELRRAQSDHPFGDGLGILAASKDGLTTGFGTTYDCRLHVGATCWFIFAELGYNPYWGE